MPSAALPPPPPKRKKKIDFVLFTRAFAVQCFPVSLSLGLTIKHFCLKSLLQCLLFSLMFRGLSTSSKLPWGVRASFSWQASTILVRLFSFISFTVWIFCSRLLIKDWKIVKLSFQAQIIKNSCTFPPLLFIKIYLSYNSFFDVRQYFSQKCNMDS